MIPWGLALRIAGPLVLAGAVFSWGYSAGGASVQRKADAALRDSLMQARSRELQWQQDAATITEVHDEEVATLRGAHAAAVAGLRDRAASRLPEAATCTSDGTGATGIQLSRPDAEFLVGEAAAADRVAADLRACQAWVKAVTRP